MATICVLAQSYLRIVPILLSDFFQLPEDWVVAKEMWHADQNSHSESVSVFLVEFFVGANCMVGVEPYRLSAEYVGQVVFCAFYVLYSVIVDLEICLYIYHPRILYLRYILELEVLEPATVRQYLDRAV